MNNHRRPFDDHKRSEDRLFISFIILVAVVLSGFLGLAGALR